MQQLAFGGAGPEGMGRQTSEASKVRLHVPVAKITDDGRYRILDGYVKLPDRGVEVWMLAPDLGLESNICHCLYHLHHCFAYLLVVLDIPSCGLLCFSQRASRPEVERAGRASVSDLPSKKAQ